MRKRPIVVVVAALGVALASTVTTASAAPTASPLGKTQAGTLAQNGGAAGYASINGLAAAYGQPANSTVAKQITTTASGLTGKVAVGAGTTSVSVGGVIGDGTATETLQATNTALKFKDAAPPFFTTDDVMSLMPMLTFSYVVTNTSGGYMYGGHYSLNLVTAKVQADDAATTPVNGHAPMKRQSDSTLTNAIVNGSDVLTALSNSYQLFTTKGADMMNAGMVRVYQGYAKGMTFDLGSTNFPFSFGYQTSGLTNGQTASLTLDPVLSASGPNAGGWLANLASGSQTNVPISFSALDWKQAFNQTALNEIVGTSVETAFKAAFSKGLNYQYLVQAISTRSNADMATDIADMLNEFLTELDKDIQAMNQNNIPMKDHPSWRGTLQMDKILGTTTFPSGLQEPNDVMYPNVKSDMSTKLFPLIKSRSTGQWNSMVLNELSGTGTTTTITRSLTPVGFTSLTATNVTATDPTSSSPSPSPSQTKASSSPAPTKTFNPLNPISWFTTLFSAFFRTISNMLAGFLGPLGF